MDTYSMLLLNLQNTLEILFQLKAYNVSLSEDEIRQLLSIVQSIEIKLEEIKCGD
jgi:hypothetical protein